MKIEMSCHGVTHVGRVRPSNEDQFLIADLNKSMKIHQTSLGLNHQTRLLGDSQGKLLVVADGLGGHASGERASTLAVDAVTNYVLNSMDWFLRLNDDNESQLINELISAVFHSQEILGNESDEIPQRRGMATTLTMAYVVWPKLYVIHVGDTRCYLLSNGKLRLLTTDHVVANLRSTNRMSRGDENHAASERPTGHSGAHALWNVVGGSHRSLQPQVAIVKLQAADKLLLCSDGLTHYLEDDVLAKELGTDKTPEQICHDFVIAANDRGGADNITAVVAAFDHVQDGHTSNPDDETGEFVLSRLS